MISVWVLIMYYFVGVGAVVSDPADGLTVSGPAVASSGWRPRWEFIKKKKIRFDWAAAVWQDKERDESVLYAWYNFDPDIQHECEHIRGLGFIH